MQTIPTGYWTFFCNPKRWAMDEFLAQNIEYDTYTIMDWQVDWFNAGQLGVVRVGTDTRNKKELSGRSRLKPGVYAIVEVLGQPEYRSGEKELFWIGTPTDISRKIVRIRYLKNLLHNPLYLEELRAIPGITDISLLNGRQASSWPLDPVTFNIISLLIGNEVQIYENIDQESADTAHKISELESKYSSASPQVKEVISKRIERGPIADQIKRLAGFKCMICESQGNNPISFYKKNGEPYVEAHHVNPISTLEPGSLGPLNIITVCPNHHCQLHYGDTELMDSTTTTFVFRIDKSIIRLNKVTF